VSSPLDAILGAAVKASRLILEVYASNFSVDYKAPKDPVTLADRLANEAICKHLGEAFPGVPIVAEESDPNSYAHFRNADRILFVDPLDGTREFVAKNGEFVVMIGLVEGDYAQHGVVLAPTRDRAWIGSVGVGAWTVDGNGVRHAVSPRPAPDLARARVVTSRSQRSSQLERMLRAGQVQDIVPLGSAGLKTAYVAAGEADAYAAWGPAGRRWDVCAPDALLHAAGGVFTDAHGVRFDYRAADLTNLQGIAAATPSLHTQLVRLLST
jgi:3'(2'), 5'-bisphosphate nucleotidase